MEEGGGLKQVMGFEMAPVWSVKYVPLHVVHPQEVYFLGSLGIQ